MPWPRRPDRPQPPAPPKRRRNHIISAIASGCATGCSRPARSKNALIADEQQQRGTVDHRPVYPREVVKRALALGASALIMVHNNPAP